MNLKKLNGWQRLGILLSAVWLAVVVVGAVVIVVSETDRLSGHQRSGRAEAEDLWAQATLHAGWDSVEMPSSFEYDPPIEDQVEAQYQIYRNEGLSNAAIVEQAHETYPGVSFSEVDAAYEDALGRLQISYQQDRQRAVLRISGYAFLVWIVPSAFVFFLGRAVVWVWRGFKKGESND